MPDPSDPLPTVRAYIAADANIDAECNGRVYVGRIPAPDVKAMPLCCIVVSDAGGNQAGGQDPEERIRVHCKVYHVTEYQARTMAFKVRRRMRVLNGYTHQGSKILTAAMSGGPITSTEPDTHWPVSFASYDIVYAEYRD